MERLTERSENGKAVYRHPTPEPEGWEANRNAVLERCCQYEDTGLTPEEIMDGKMLTSWIPVEKRVPEENGLYVVAIKGMGIAGPIYACDLTDYENESGWYARNVVAWLPCKLPKPYRPELLREAGQDAAAQVLQSET